MKTIPLTQGKVAIVDDVDFDELNRHKWCARKDNKTNSWYVCCKIKGKTVLMHRHLLVLGKNQFGDHRNGNGLDNQRHNLRKCSFAENTRNRKKPLGGTSKYKGVSWYISLRKWTAKIVNYKYYHLGYFDNELDAAKAYDQAAIRYFGKFARLNFTSPRIEDTSLIAV